MDGPATAPVPFQISIPARVSARPSLPRPRRATAHPRRTVRRPSQKAKRCFWQSATPSSVRGSAASASPRNSSRAAA
jgi:hypothetical protein